MLKRSATTKDGIRVVREGGLTDGDDAGILGERRINGAKAV